MGSEGPQWWHSFPDKVRDLHPGGILDRCERTNTCPKIIETFGGSEVFALKMTTSWVGTDPKNDIPLPGATYAAITCRARRTVAGTGRISGSTR